MTVKVVINRTKTKAVEITRRWYFRTNGNWTAEEETIVRHTVRGVADTPKLDGKGGFHLSDLLDEIFVPAHIAPFFFFDGEEVKKLADQSRVEQVKQGLEGLLGVVLLRTLAERLKTFENTKRSGVATVDEDNFNRLVDQLAENQAKLKESQSERSECESKIDLLRAERGSLIERITAVGGGGGDIATVRDLVEEREQFRNKTRECQRRLEEILSGRLPFHLVGKDLMESFKNQLKEEIRLYAWEAEKSALEPRKAEFERSFLKQETPVVNPALTDDQILAIKCRIEAAWGSLFYPPPDDCAKELVHHYMYGPARERALDFLDSVALGQKEIQDLLREQQEYTERVEELDRKISRLEGIDRDGTLTALKSELEQVQKKIDELTERVRVDDRTITAIEAQVASQKAEYERERRKLDESSPVRVIIEKSERVRAVLDDVIPALFPLKVNELASAMTSVYKRLAHKDIVAKIEIKDDGRTVILGKTGKEISFDRSAGENQIFATALIAGLAKVSGVKAPMVVDTPLGRLDSKHRGNILNFWTGEATRQVILLSQDEEIDYTFYKQISGSVCKTYLLEHMDVGDGIGRTIAKEDAYFARGRR